RLGRGSALASAPARGWRSSSAAATRPRSRSVRRSRSTWPLFSGPAHRLERLVHAGEGRNRHEALVALPGDVDLLLEVEEDVRRVVHQDLGELSVGALALGHDVGAARLLQQLIDLRVLVVGEVATLPLTGVPDGVGE